MVGIGGEPATGKTTLMQRVFPDLPSTPVHKIRLLKYHELMRGGRLVAVMGDYSGGIFGGTDKLSMAVLPEFLSVLRVWSMERHMRGASVVFEGDRLFGRKTVLAVQEMKDEFPLGERVRDKWIVLTTDPGELEQRHASRGDTQSASWLQGRATKAKRLLDEFRFIDQRPNDSMEQAEETACLIESWLEGEPK